MDLGSGPHGNFSTSAVLNPCAMNEDPLPHLEDALLRRDLTPDEKRTLTDWLTRHPEAAADWQEKSRLARALRALPDVPVPSNFTSRVLSQVRREMAASERARTANASRWSWLRPRFWVPAATTAVAMVVALGGWNWRTEQQQAEFRRDVRQLHTLASVPQEVLEDFEVIQRFGQSAPPVDFELLAALE